MKTSLSWFCIALAGALAQGLFAEPLTINWKDSPDRRWAGPHLWTNRLQDWKVHNGNLALENTYYLNSATVMTRELTDAMEPFEMETTFRYIKLNKGRVGFLLGAGEGHLDYRAASLVHGNPGKGGGLLALMDLQSQELSFRDMGRDVNELERLPDQTSEKDATLKPWTDVRLALEAEPRGRDRYRLTLSAFDAQSGSLVGRAVLEDYPAGRLRGVVGIVGQARQWDHDIVFKELSLSGPKFLVDESRAFGPIVGTLFTVADHTLKLAVQCASLGDAKIPGEPDKSGYVWVKGFERISLTLEGRPAGSNAAWKQLAPKRPVMRPHYHVVFRVEDWDSSRAWETRVTMTDADGKVYRYYTYIPAEPEGVDELTVGTFSCMGASAIQAQRPVPKHGPGEKPIARWSPAGVWAPWNQLVESMKQQDPDILFFTGDQIYEGFPTRPVQDTTNPVEDYFYKFFIWHLAFRELSNHIPAVLQTDDHDVYQGNLWGNGPSFNTTGRDWFGGYEMSPFFINLVHRTMTGHMPDPIHPYDIDSGLTNYYTDFTYGGIDVFVAEDRKFKAAPGTKPLDEYSMLGEEQFEAIREWANTDRGLPKLFVSQTIYASINVNFDGEFVDETDSNNWPKVSRDALLRELSKGSTVILSGDQHLSTMAKLGVDAPEDAVYQFAAPAAGNIYWRWFYPAEPGENRDPGMAEHLGDFTDYRGNHYRLLAVANPESPDLLDRKLRQRIVIDEESYNQGIGRDRHTCQGQGYGVVRYNFADEEVTFEAWPYDAYPDNQDSPYPGWPHTVSFDDL